MRNQKTELSEALNEHLQKIAAGIHTFVKLTALREQPHEIKYIQDEFDLLEALDITKTFLLDTSSMLGKQKYKGHPTFDFVNDVKENLEELYLTGQTPQQAAIARKKYGAMYNLVIEPTIEMMRVFDHGQALQQADPVINQVKHLVLNNETLTNYDDAIVNREIIRNMIAAREEVRKQSKRSRRKKVEEETFVFSEYEELNFTE